MKAKRILKKLRMGALAAGVSAALLVPAPPVAEANILVDVITGAIGASAAYSTYLNGILNMGNDPVVQQKLFDEDRAENGVDESAEDAAVIDSVMNQLIERGEYAMMSDSLPFRWSVNADESFNASCSAANYISINKGLLTALNGDRDELAGVLAHEMIHGLHQHIAFDVAKQAAIQYGASALGGDSLSSLLVGVITNYHTAKNITAPSEKDADESGFWLMASAGFNPGGFPAMIYKMPDSHAESIINPDDHPETSNRLKRGLKWMNQYSCGHVEAKDDAVFIDGQHFLTMPANDQYSAKERACLVAGGIAKGFHDNAMASSWRFTKLPNGSVDYLDDSEAYRHLKAAVAEANLGAQLETLVNTAYSKDRDGNKREKYLEKERERREDIEKEKAKALRNKKKNIDSYKEKSLTYNALNLPSLAIHEADRLLACEPDNDAKAWAHAERGRAFYQMDMYDTALAELNTSATLAPKEARTYLYRGYALHAIGDYDAALADSMTAEKLSPGTFAANLRLQGMSYEAKGEDDLAIQAYRAYLEKNPKGAVPEKYADALTGR
ncbi:MAG: M48 family metalloprotease [Schwartzia sp.]|nr:M48 family metalloprotease [Schwartzia sp. (in: firmicutes)]